MEGVLSARTAGRGRRARYNRSASVEDFRPARVEVVDDPAMRIAPPADVSRDMQVAALLQSPSGPAVLVASPCAARVVPLACNLRAVQPFFCRDKAWSCMSPRTCCE